MPPLTVPHSDIQLVAGVLHAEFLGWNKFGEIAAGGPAAQKRSLNESECRMHGR